MDGEPRQDRGEIVMDAEPAAKGQAAWGGLNF